MTALLAAAPLVLVLIGMGILRWPAAVAGGAASLLALLNFLLLFDADAETSEKAAVVGGAVLEALHTTATILWIILPALALYELQRRAGALDRIRGALVGLTQERRLQAVLIAWFFGLFMEGAAGFGTPIALAAPLLVGLGYAPVKAVALALFGHAAGVSFGAVGTPVLAQAEVTDLPAAEIAAATALLHALPAMILLFFLVRLAGEGPLARRELGWTALAGLSFLAPFLALALLAGAELPTLGGALIGALFFVTALRRRQSGAVVADRRRLVADLAPYLAILVLVLATRLIPLLREHLTGLVIDWTLQERFRGSFQPLYHPGTLLFAGFFLGGLATGRAQHVLPALAAAVRRLAPVALALVAMLAMSRIMVHSGMIRTLAEEAARAGTLWALIAPAFGVVGTFVSGSATASNILFSEFQVTTATALSLPAILLVAAQGFGAAIGNIVAPHNIIAGSATVGLRGREGDVLARTAAVCAVYAAIGGGLVLAVASF